MGPWMSTLPKVKPRADSQLPAPKQSVRSCGNTTLQFHEPARHVHPQQLAAFVSDRIEMQDTFRDEAFTVLAMFAVYPERHSP